MFTPHTYLAALGLMLLSMICWGSWANTQKADKAWRFELFYLDYSLGLLVCALLAGLTLGNTHPGDADSFLQNLIAADPHHMVDALVGGVVFTLGNLLLVAAISVAGMSVAFPVGSGLGLVIGAVLNYVISPKGNPWLIFSGIALVCVAIALDALAYRAHEAEAETGTGGAAGKSVTKGLVLSILGGIGAGLFYPFVAKALTGAHHLVPYTVNVIFAGAAGFSAIPIAWLFMRFPVAGGKLGFKDYFAGRPALHVWGVLGGLIWGVGTIANFVASYVPMIGPATSFSLGEGNTMISAVWGVFVWHEFRGADARTRVLLGLMFAAFLLGLTSIALAPVVR